MYYAIDALDSDLPTLRSLQALRLYRNYICRWRPAPCPADLTDLYTRAADGLMSTGMREETFNVVITAGGFASDAINPLDVTEMLRPEGYLLWTLRTVGS